MPPTGIIGIGYARLGLPGIVAIYTGSGRKPTTRGTMNKAPISIAIVGLGDAARQHLRAWRKLNNIIIAAVCDSNKLKAEETARAWGVAAYSDDLGEILRKQSLSVVDICTPPLTHCSLIRQALEVGCHVIVEKPLTMTSDEAKMIMSAQRGSKAKVTCTGTVGLPRGTLGELSIVGDSINLRKSFPSDAPVIARNIAVVEAFNKWVKDNINTYISGYNGMQMVKIEDAILESSRQGKAIKINQ